MWIFYPLGYHLRPGKIYRFRLAVGSPWHSVDIFFEVSCCKRRIIIHQEDQEVELELPVTNPITQEESTETKADRDSRLP
ncbi:hypothetical protein N7U66_10680 [Lacinutrix neustonica]|uniref:Uncharacterized protein n=1 Tax=Lacinutrix neustonica TaxID=2980107 RepID=A0A9E8SIM9_9FLAO|nr:hypothetical protein [Lacinutrix neustonica]WAC03830.1 hypothetical protein N7U66_10680 [Lacinutrix neustonica]